MNLKSTGLRNMKKLILISITMFALFVIIIVLGSLSDEPLNPETATC